MKIEGTYSVAILSSIKGNAAEYPEQGNGLPQYIYPALLDELLQIKNLIPENYCAIFSIKPVLSKTRLPFISCLVFFMDFDNKIALNFLAYDLFPLTEIGLPNIVTESLYPNLDTLFKHL